jgi:hypothetical protein
MTYPIRFGKEIRRRIARRSVTYTSHSSQNGNIVPATVAASHVFGIVFRNVFGNGLSDFRPGSPHVLGLTSRQ